MGDENVGEEQTEGRRGGEGQTGGRRGGEGQRKVRGHCKKKLTQVANAPLDPGLQYPQRAGSRLPRSSYLALWF